MAHNRMNQFRALGVPLLLPFDLGSEELRSFFGYSAVLHTRFQLGRSHSFRKRVCHTSTGTNFTAMALLVWRYRRANLACLHAIDVFLATKPSFRQLQQHFRASLVTP